MHHLQNSEREVDEFDGELQQTDRIMALWTVVTLRFDHISQDYQFEDVWPELILAPDIDSAENQAKRLSRFSTLGRESAITVSAVELPMRTGDRKATLELRSATAMTVCALERLPI